MHPATLGLEENLGLKWNDAMSRLGQLDNSSHGLLMEAMF